MSPHLSARTEELIQQLFPSGDRAHIRTELHEKCNREALGCTEWTEKEMERIWFAILKAASGDTRRFEAAVALARTDWRDVLVEAGFGTDLDAHEMWRTSVL